MAGTLIVTTLSGGGAPIEAPDGINIDGSPVLTQGVPGSPTVLRNLQVLGPSSTFQVAPTTAGSLDNVNIGSTTPASAAFATLLTLGPVIIGDSPTDPVTFNSNNINIPNNLSFDSNTLFIDAANNRVGINNATPTVALDVTGSGSFTGNLTYTASLTGGTGVINIGSNQFYKDTAGNIGLDVVPSAWREVDKALQIRNTVLENVNNAAASYGFNYYRESSFVSRYITSDFATQIVQNNGNNGSIVFNIAPSGTAGNPITFTQALTLTNSGNLGLGITPTVWQPSAKALQVSSRLALWQTGGGSGALSYNCYSDTDGVDRYLTSGVSAQLMSFDGVGSVIFSNAPSGTAGAATTFTQRLFLNSLGNLGLGVTPNAWSSAFKVLTLAAQGSSIAANGNNRVEICTNSFLDASDVRRYVSANFAALYEQTLGTHVWNTASSGTAGAAVTFNRVMTLNNAGRLDLGETTSPANVASLRIYRGGGNPNYLQLDTAAGNSRLLANGIGGLAAALIFANDANTGTPTEMARFSEVGNLLIGTTRIESPTTKLWVRGASANTIQNQPFQDVQIRLGNTDQTDETAATLYLETTDSANFVIGTGAVRAVCTSHIANTVSSYLSFYTTNTSQIREAGRFSANRYFKASNTPGVYGGVAGLSDLSASSNHVFQASAGNNLYVINAGTGASDNCVQTFLPTGATGFHYRGFINAVSVYQVLANGDVQNANNIYAAISDQDLKENIVDAPSYLSRFMQVRFCNFNFKETTGYETHKQFGVIAQEIELIFPSLVTSTPNLDAEGNDLGTVTKSVKFSVLTAIYGKVIQEQQTLIEDQAVTIQSQQDQITTLSETLADVLVRLTALESA